MLLKSGIIAGPPWGMVPQRRNFCLLVTLLFLSLYFNWRVTHCAVERKPAPFQHRSMWLNPYVLPLPVSKDHLIDELVQNAQKTFKELAPRRIESVHDAAQAYRFRRGRHPPPRFDEWLSFAQSKNVIVWEHLFDQIYEDLEPFWAVKPEQIRQQTALWPHRLSHREGQTTKISTLEVMTFVDDWKSMLEALGKRLPDMDLALNIHDEPFVFAPWDKINEYVKQAERTRNMRFPTADTNFSSTYQPLQNVSSSAKDPPENVGLLPIDGPRSLWSIIRDSCPAESPARHVDMPDSFKGKLPFTQPAAVDFVSNWTQAKSVCHNPDVRLLHGSFVAPNIGHVIPHLFPLFSGCKIAGVNNDILLPAAMYWSANSNFHVPLTSETPWATKKSQAIWRGTASGGQHNASNWWPFQRHRLVAMMNSTQVNMRERAEAPHFEAAPDDPLPPVNESLVLRNYPMPPPGFGPSSPPADPHLPGGINSRPGRLSEWVNLVGEASFVHYYCSPLRFYGGAKSCDYLEPYYRVKPSVSMEKQLAEYKYLPDIDGQSHSGRYRALLQSNSVPIKATIFSEWHDSRLLPWVHFVPMSNGFEDWWGIMEYFLGDKNDAKIRSRRKLKIFADLKGGDMTSEEAEQAKKEANENPIEKGELKEGDGDPELWDYGHDEVAMRIAEQGADWAAKVLSRDDMLVYTYRLLLEYARIANDERDWLAYVEDIA